MYHISQLSRLFFSWFFRRRVQSLTLVELLCFDVNMEIIIYELNSEIERSVILHSSEQLVSALCARSLSIEALTAQNYAHF